jgi:hypothetical protein
MGFKESVLPLISDLDLIQALLALATFFLVIWLGLALNRAFPRKRGTKLEKWRLLQIAVSASALALLIVTLQTLRGL